MAEALTHADQRSTIQSVSAVPPVVPPPLKRTSSWETADVEEREIREVLEDQVVRELLGETKLTRLAYTARDGSPRVIPMGFVMRSSRVVVCSASFAPKVLALRDDPRVALTIDLPSHPPRALLLRGLAKIEIVQGVPEEYLEASHLGVSDEHWAAFEADVRTLYDEMARISIEVVWAKIIDFQLRMPDSIDELVQRRNAKTAASPPGGRRPPPWAQGAGRSDTR